MSELSEGEVPTVTQLAPGKIKSTIEGKEHTFEVPIRTLYLTVQELRSVLQLQDHEANGREEEILKPAIVGTGVLESRDTIEVIGKSGTQDTRLSVSFKVLSKANRDEFAARYSGAMRAEWDAAQKAAEDRKGFAKMFLDRLGVNKVPNVSLSYSEHDWEIGNPSEWWAEFHLSESTVAELRAALESGKLISLRIGVELWNVYSNRKHYVPSESAFPWFVKPEKYGAEIVQGAIRALSVETARVSTQPPAPDEDREQPAIMTPAQQAKDEGMGALRDEVARLRAAVKGAAWAVCGTLAVLWILFR